EKQFYKQNTGGTQKFIALGIIREMIINLPCFEEQIKIANFLSSIDKKIEQLTQKQSLLQQYKKGVMQKLFSQEIRFKDGNGKEFPEWEEKKLGDVGDIITGKTPSTSDESLWDGNIQFVTPTDISDEKYQYKTLRTVTNHSKLKILPAGSIMFTCIASIGKMSLSTQPCITNQQINSIVPNNKHNNEYIYYAVLSISDFIKSTQANTTLPIINKTEFSKFEILVPDIDEQTKIANFLSSIDKKIELISEEIDKAKEFKKGLLQQMFV
ncbi:MAG: restriction endonuclease subunit S, partial [Arcobacteraceae bacterium]|nr:restriction endonuclease subunit S [Arcobacteraceae bacterium]